LPIRPPTDRFPLAETTPGYGRRRVASIGGSTDMAMRARSPVSVC